MADLAVRRANLAGDVANVIVRVVRSRAAPEWRLCFRLPNSVMTKPGPFAPVLGARIHGEGEVEIVGRNRGWVETQAERLVRMVAPYGFVRPVEAVMARDADSPEASRPARRATRIECRIDWDGRDVHLVTRHTSHRLG